MIDCNPNAEKNFREELKAIRATMSWLKLFTIVAGLILLGGIFKTFEKSTLIQIEVSILVAVSCLWVAKLTTAQRDLSDVLNRRLQWSVMTSVKEEPYAAACSIKSSIVFQGWTQIFLGLPLFLVPTRYTQFIDADYTLTALAAILFILPFNILRPLKILD